MFAATGGQYLQFCSQDQCPSASSHKIPIFAFPYKSPNAIGLVPVSISGIYSEIITCFPRIAKDPLRNLKNLGIVLVTLASHAAIRGGLSPEISFSLSDSYIQQIEECRDIALITPLTHKAEFQYAGMVHEIKEQQKGVSKKQKNPRINKCRDFIFSHLHDRITLEDLAAEADCNPNYPSQLFKEC